MVCYKCSNPSKYSSRVYTSLTGIVSYLCVCTDARVFKGMEVKNYMSSHYCKLL